jgi:hypothetical protein
VTERETDLVWSSFDFPSACSVCSLCAANFLGYRNSRLPVYCSENGNQFYY